MKKAFMHYILPITIVIALVLLDQWVKYLTIENIPLNTSVPLIEGVFELNYIRNQGMAWGMLQNMQWLFIIMTPLILAAVWFSYVRMPHEKRFLPVRIAEVLISAGAIGNCIDRIFRGELFKGYVVDMFYVKAINFPVFNVADSYVSVAFVALLILIVFVYKDDDFAKIIPFGNTKSQKGSETE